MGWRGLAGLEGNVVLYTTLMTVCHKGGQPERAMRIFRAMEGEGLQADVVRPSPFTASVFLGTSLQLPARYLQEGP